MASMIKEHIASSISISLEDMDYAQFNQKDGRMKLFKVFGDDYEKILSELHEVLINSSVVGNMPLRQILRHHTVDPPSCIIPTQPLP